MLESIRNAITHLQMDQLGRNFGGRIPSCSQYCYNSSSMGPIGTTLGWSRPSNTSAAKPFPWYLVVTANRTENVLVLLGVEIKNIHNFHETANININKCVSKTDTNPPFAFQIAFQRGTGFAGFPQGGSKSRNLQSEISVQIESRIESADSRLQFQC